jgi:lysophospholipase L1-like esterase
MKTFSRLFAANASPVKSNFSNDPNSPWNWLAISAIALTIGIMLSTPEVGAQAVRNDHQHWIGTWATEPVAGTANTPTYNGQTVRNVMRVSIGGESIRIRLSNHYGSKPLRIGAAHVAIHGEGAAIAADSDRALTFGGNSSVLIPAGGLVISDPAQLHVKDLEELAVSIYSLGILGGPESTVMDTARQTNYVSAAGDFTASASLPDSTSVTTWFYLTGVEVLADEKVGAVVTMGDSITNCSQCPIDSNTRWPDYLAERIVHSGSLRMAVLNTSKAGNRIIYDGNGDNSSRRFDRDVLDIPGVTHLIVYLGNNVIGRPSVQAPPPQGYPGTDVTAEEMISGLRQLILRSHEHGIKVIASTITPFEDTTFFKACCYYTKEGEVKRQVVNAWIRSTKELDGVVDFDVVVRDPNHVTQWLPIYERGDHLHSGPVGNKKMAESIDLRLLQ